MPSGVTRVPRNATLSPDCATSRQVNSPSTNNQVIFAMLPMVRSAVGLWGLNRGHCRLPGKKEPAEGYAAEHNGHPHQGGHGIVHKNQKGDQRRQDNKTYRRDRKPPASHRLAQSEKRG